MFGTAKANALGVEFAGDAGVGGGVGIGADAHVTGLIGPFHQLAKRAVQRGLQHLGCTGQRLTGGAVDGDDVPLLEHTPVFGGDDFVAAVNFHPHGANHTGQAKAAGNHGGVAGHATLDRQYPDRRVHTAHIFGGGFAAHKDAILATGLTGLGCIGGKHNAPAGGTGAGGDALLEHITRAFGVNLVVQQFA